MERLPGGWRLLIAGGAVHAGLSQAELADYLALTPETFCRKVSKFRQLGWISGNGNNYVVRRPEALRDVAGSFD